MVVGYAWLRDSLNLPIPAVARPASVQPVSRVMVQNDGSLAVSAAVAPRAQADALDHTLFALKHEGCDLLVLSHALMHISTERMAAAVRAAPSGRFVRQAGMLWEHFHAAALPRVNPSGATVDLFDPELYRTSNKPIRNARWRVNFNGFGSLDYCPTVRRTATINARLEQNLLGKASDFAARIGPALLDRALAWAYLSETESSFAIEREAPSHDKSQAFAALLRQAGESRKLSEDYLVELQNAAITNPLEQASQYRTVQNHLHGSARGAAGVTYVPPPPALVPGLMDSLFTLATSEQEGDPLVLAALVSFGFVFIHPFMDGNGRLSRFLVHDVIGRSRRLPQGFVLPISVAMKRHEMAYLQALQSFSKPLREWWRVTWIDEGQYTFDPLSNDNLYRYWDATPCVEFLLDMAQEALLHDLTDETRFLLQYDAALQAIEARFDLRSVAVATLLRHAFTNDGKLSNNRRKQFADVVPNAAFDAIETIVTQQLAMDPLPTVALRPAPKP